ncbi:hypothetical protein Curi_c06310 [Gottschalkia acidurici 9a]|uniref:Uncharacterized protein n=1 Tax=Gottschalkia acidurici (strain ATCC 7906 / DSM 604 / BCRC 14475 / CIP 104303 / KCTC 5404 / NCIMB 10678 / 9a) TaxID=1128398 RepID=K0AWU0_GOTA9|nr:hypothetical protein [Gottschalkia acidurici]AFS77704.1 hypothetical protein Curi_c06310 [Gottschalkia acidurici 9a]
MKFLILQMQDIYFIIRYNGIRKCNMGWLYLLYMGTLLIIIGSYSILEDFYDFKSILKERVLVKKENVNIDGYLKVKAMIGIFSIVVGILSIINYIYY